MKTKVKPTVEKWRLEFVKIREKNYKEKWGDQVSLVEEIQFIEKLLSHSVQEAKAETISMIIDRIEMWADDGQIPTTEHITSRLSYLLASLKQEEEQ